jgi:hypothetical protein
LLFAKLARFVEIALFSWLLKIGSLTVKIGKRTLVCSTPESLFNYKILVTQNYRNSAFSEALLNRPSERYYQYYSSPSGY